MSDPHVLGPIWLLITSAVNRWGQQASRGETFQGRDLTPVAFTEVVRAVMADGGEEPTEEVVRHIAHYAELRPHLLEPLLGVLASAGASDGPELTVVISQSGPDILIEHAGSRDNPVLALTVRGLTLDEIARR